MSRPTKSPHHQTKNTKTQKQTHINNMKTYIQRKGDGYLETVDEFSTRKEARAMLLEYRTADPSASYYLSSRPCKDWNK